MENTKVAGRTIDKVTVQYTDGSIEVIEGFAMVVKNNTEGKKWAMELTSEATLDKVLEFAYDAVDVLEFERIQQEDNKTKHLSLVKG